ncbi:MAG: glycoside hydrolase family 127 protein, partial [Acidobacteriaceae bacterium]|nr:glycoside hydrolase family 127 protein [Acidobacteriaceae bacterium]
RSTSISVNGKRQKAAVIPGKFFALQREWKTGDIVELELHQRLRTEAVDRQTPEQVAVLRGPQVLFAIANTQPELTAKQFESLTIKRAENYDWTTEGLSPNLRLRPFYAIGDEVYQTYWKVNV